MAQEKFTQQDIMKRFMKALDEDQTSINGHTLIDNAIAQASSGTNRFFSSWEDVATKFLEDLDSADSADSFLRNVCGFIPYNEDTGSITGFDVGSGKVKTKQSIVPENGEAKDLVALYKAYIANGCEGDVSTDDPTLKIDKTGLLGLGSKTLSFTKNGLTLIVENYDQLVKDADAALAKAEDARSKKEQYALSKINIINGLYTWWLEGALNLIAESYGENIGFSKNSSATVNQIKLVFPEDKSALASVNVLDEDTDGNCTELTLEISMINYGNVNLAIRKDGSSYLDATLAHEFTHGTMATNIRHMTSLPVMIKEGTGEFTAGADLGRYSGIKKLAQAYKNAKTESERNQTVLARVLKDYDTTYSPAYFSYMPKYKNDENIADREVEYYVGYSLIRYFAKQCSTPNYVPARFVGNLIGTLTITTENGELLQGNNGFVSLEKGDSVNIDSNGNIDTIFISDKSHIVTTPDSTISVNIKHGGEVIAKVTGSSIVQFDEHNDYKLKITSNNNNIKVEGTNIEIASGGGTINFTGHNSKLFIVGDKDTVTIEGSNNHIDKINNGYTDSFVISKTAKNNIISGFLDYQDWIRFEAGEIAAEIQEIDGMESVVISSATTGDTIVILAGVTNGIDNHIVWHKDDGGTISTSIDWLLTNTTPISPGSNNPERPNFKTIMGTSYNDNINNSLASMMINALSGNDTISNSGSEVTVLGGTGNDSIYNKYDGSNSKIVGGENNDSITNYAENVTINGGTGDDNIYNPYSVKKVTIYGGTGNDSLRNAGTNITMDGGADDDDIYNCGATVSIVGGTGNDTIESDEAMGVVIYGGEGNDSLKNGKRSYASFIDGGEGKDTISNRSSSVTADGGADDDYITNYLNGYTNNVSISGNVGNDTILNIPLNGYYGTENESGAITLDGGDGDDSIYSSGYNIADVTTKNQNIGVIKGGAGNDSIYYDRFSTYTWEINYSGAVSIEGNEGEDLISIRGGGFATINAGNGNDKIYIDNNFASINAGIGNDTIYVNGSTGGDQTFKYSLGDGNDVVYLPSTKANSVFVNVTGGICKKIINGNDIIVSVGEESITFKDAIDKSISVKGESVSGSVSLLGTEGNDNFYRHPGIYVKSATGYDSYDGTVTYINGLDGNDQISHTVNSATLLGETGNDTIYNSGNRALIDGGIGEDKLSNSGSNATIYGNNGNDSISNSGSNALVNGGTGNDTISNGDIDWRTYDENVTINGEDGDDLIINVCHNVTIYGGAGNDSIYNNYNSANIYIDGGEGNNFINLNPHDTRSITTTINVSSGTNTIEIDSSEFKQFNTFMHLNIEDFGVDDVITFSDAITSLNGSSDSLVAVVNKIPVTIEGLTFSSTAAHFSGLTYKSASNTASYSLSSDKKSIFYTPAIPESNLFTLSNVKNTDSIVVDTSKKTVTLSANNLTSKNVSITGDYSLKLANDVPTSTTKTAGSFTKFKSGTATFKTSSFSDFYSLKNNAITYTAPSGGKTISIKNLKSSATLDEIKSGITISEQKNGSCKITFKSANVLTTKAPVISVTDVTYTVAIDKSLNPASLAPDWKVSGTNASLKSDTSAGYTVSDNKVLYSKKVTGSPQLVLSGLVKNSSLSAPVKKVVTLDTKVLGSNSSLKSNTGSYTVKLTGNMSKKTFTGSANADTLNIAANNAAVLGGSGNDSFSVTGSKVTLTGGKGNDSFKLSGKSPVLIYAAGNGNDTVNFVAGMHISLSGSTQIKTLSKSGSDLLLGFGKNSSVKVTGAKSTDTIKVSDASGSVTLVAGKFDLANNLTFNSKNSSVKVAKNFSGSLAPSDDIYLSGSKLSKVATINAGNVTSEITISGNAKANFISAGKNNDSILGGNGNDSIAGNAGNDKLYGQNGNDSLGGGKGNDSLWGGDGKDVFIYSAGNDVIADFTAGQDKIQIASGKISKTSLSGSNVRFTIGKGSLTVKNAKGKTINLLNSAGKASSTVVGAQTLTNSNKASVTIAADLGVVDASARTKAIKITGNALANTISGGTKNDSLYGAAGNDSILGNDGSDKLYGDAGNDVLLGGKGNDSLWGGANNDTLTGGDGNDFFIYEAGKDLISDYTAGQDKIQIASGKISKTSLSGSDVLFTIGKGSLTVKNAKGKSISLLDSAGKASSTVVGAQVLTNSNKASVTIGADMGVVDSSSRSKAIKITGNALANTISGGTKNDSIFGAEGNDSILGNDGNDQLYGDAGNDILLGGKGNDSLNGGAGNDSLWGDAGKDTFIYTANEGTDKIFDYETGDLLKILNADGSDGYFKSSKYSGGDLTLTINGGGKIIFEDVVSSTKFNINGSSYNISGSKLVKK